MHALCSNHCLLYKMSLISQVPRMHFLINPYFTVGALVSYTNLSLISVALIKEFDCTCTFPSC